MADVALAQAARDALERGDAVSPPDYAFAPPGEALVMDGIPRLLEGSILAGRYCLKRHLNAGQFGRGWVASVVDEPESEVFIKTFRANGDRAINGGKMADPAWHENLLRREVEVCMRQDDALPHNRFVTRNSVYHGDLNVVATGITAPMFFIMSPDYAAGGELFDYICYRVQPFVESFSERAARHVFVQLQEAISFLHSHGVFHRDLKLENLVMDGDMNIKVMDFGAAKHAYECEVDADGADDAGGELRYVTRTVIGTAAYQPPELRRGAPLYNPAAFDVWSMGVILFFLVGIRTLYEQERSEAFFLFQRIAQRAPNYARLLDAVQVDAEGVPVNEGFWRLVRSWGLELSPELTNLFNRMFDVNPARRITAAAIADHPWMQQADMNPDEFADYVRARPVERFHDHLLPLAGLGQFDVVHARVMAECETIVRNAVEEGQEPLAVDNVEGRIHVGREPVLFVCSLDYERNCSVHWNAGSLNEWLYFVTNLRHALGVLA